MSGEGIGRVAVLGAGVMGAQIAAVMANAGLTVDLLDLPAAGATDGLAQRGIDGLHASRAPALFLPEYADRIRPGSLETLDCLAGADWIIEAVVERLEVKRELLGRVAAAASASAVLSTNTSGLSITAMAQGLPEATRGRFLGIHFFNPPRQMRLVELIPGADTDPQVVDRMRRFLEEDLGKGVVEARDTPNFIANRLGVFALMQALHGMAAGGLEVETVDAVTGTLLGRPRTATLRLCDLIGLDILVHVADTAYEQLPEEGERPIFAPPDFVREMLDRDLLGIKNKAGFYRKTVAGIEALDPGTMQYRASRTPDLGALAGAVRERSLSRRLESLWGEEGTAAGFARGNLCAVLAYAAAHGEEMAGDLLQIDRAMRWGFNWEAGPFELWDAVGVDRVLGELERQEIAAPSLAERVACGSGRFYCGGSDGPQVYSAATGAHVAIASAPGASAVLLRDDARFANEAAYLGVLQQDVGILVFESKMNVLGPAALEMVRRACEDESGAGLVLWGAGDLFSVGADLAYMVGLAEEGAWTKLEGYVKDFQDAIMALRFAPFPVVTALKGLALGGGCEFGLGTDARVAAAETRIGLVETAVGLVPAGGGCKELVRRGRGLLRAYQTIAGGRFTDNARQGQAWHLLDDGDEVLINGARLLGRAQATAAEFAASGYQPPARAPVPVRGSDGERELLGWLDGLAEKNKLSEHDRLVGTRLAHILSGGGGAAREVDEQELLDLERTVFMELCGIEKTRERMQHMLNTGKSLRN